jgi:hypothetical protein
MGCQQEAATLHVMVHVNILILSIAITYSDYTTINITCGNRQSRTANPMADCVPYHPDSSGKLKQQSGSAPAGFARCDRFG